MKKNMMMMLCAGSVLCAGFSSLNAKEIKLMKAQLKGGKPLMECFAARKTARSFNTKKQLSPQVLSNLLFAADGINRKDGRKTVPTARNVQNQSVYVCMQNGVWLYQAKTHSLLQISTEDIRAKVGPQPFNAKAPVILVYVSKINAVGKNSFEKTLYSGDHAGHASQNVYLYAASEGLSTVLCGMVKRDELKKMLKLSPDQIAIFSQPVGYPAK